MILDKRYLQEHKMRLQINLRCKGEQDKDARIKDVGMWYLALLVANLLSSSWVSLSLLTLVCSEVLMDTEVSLQ